MKSMFKARSAHNEEGGVLGGSGANIVYRNICSFEVFESSEVKD